MICGESSSVPVHAAILEVHLVTVYVSRHSTTSPEPPHNVVSIAEELVILLGIAHYSPKLVKSDISLLYFGVSVPLIVPPVIYLCVLL